MEKLSSDIVDSVFGTTTNDLAPVIKTTYSDADGKVVGRGAPTEMVSDDNWVARVSSMSLSIKVTPKIGNDYIGVERQIVVDVNTLDKEVVYGIWKNLQEQVVSGVFNTLQMTLKQLNEVKKAG